MTRPRPAPRSWASTCRISTVLEGRRLFRVPRRRRRRRNTTRFSDYRGDPIGNALGTPSGKIEIYSWKIESFGYDDCPPHPTWIEPAEWLGSDQTAKYPLHMISPHRKYRLHSQMDNTWLRDGYEVAGREPMWINPADAKAAASPAATWCACSTTAAPCWPAPSSLTAFARAW